MKKQTIYKRLLVGLVLQLLGLLAFSQSNQVTGVIVSANDNSPLIGTHIYLKNSDGSRNTTSDFIGKFQFKNVENGQYILEVSYIGYQSITRSVNVSGESISLGFISMQEGIDLEEVQVVEQVLPVVQKGDTTQFNADAYKVMADADAADLLEKMPTVVVEDGSFQAQGEDVKKVLVDGKPFFGNDPTAALKNLPAEVIDKIQIYDEQSDQAKFTGFDDGETSKTINIITKSNMRNGQFGKIYAGYGYDNKYSLGGNINIFNGDQRISVIGLANNINQQNFSSEDLLGVIGSSGERRGPGGKGGPGRGQSTVSASDFLVSQDDGITTSNALGINFTDKWGDKLDVSASYFFNQSNNITEQSLTQQYFDSEGLNEIYQEESLVQSTNINHRFNGIFDYKIDENNSMILRSTATWQENNGTESVLGQTYLDTDLLNQLESDFTANLNALSLTNSLLWRHRFAKRGRTFSVNFTSGYSPQSGDKYLLSDNIFGLESTAIDQYSTYDNNSWSLSTDIRYTEPITEKSQLMVDYKASYQQEDSNTETYDIDSDSELYDIFNEDLSNVFSNDYFSQEVGSGVRYRNGDWRMMGRAAVQKAELLTDQSFPYEASTQNDFLTVLPMAMVSYRKSRTENVHMMYRTNTSLPSLSQLQNVIDNSNPVQLTVGNPNLVQAYQNTLRGKFSKTNTEKSSVFFGMLSGTLTNDYIATSTYLSAADYDASLEEDAQISVPVNLDGYYNLRSFFTYGFPVKAVKSNLNIDLTANHTHTPGLINEDLNYANNSNAGIGLTLASNISDQVDFTISSRSNYNIVTNTLQSASNSTYLNQKTKVKLDWIIAKGFVFRTDLTHDFYDGFSDDFDQNYLLWNMSVGKKILKNDRGEISITIFDLLNQNTALSRNVTEVYTEDIQTNVLQQYAMASFKYDLRNFNVKQ